MSVNCSRCGSALEALGELKFCDQCGTPVDSMPPQPKEKGEELVSCGQCGRKAEASGANFCDNCGASMPQPLSTIGRGQAHVSSPALVQVSKSFPPPPQAPPPEPPALAAQGTPVTQSNEGGYDCSKGTTIPRYAWVVCCVVIIFIVVAISVTLTMVAKGNERHPGTCYFTEESELKCGDECVLNQDGGRCEDYDSIVKISKVKFVRSGDSGPEEAECSGIWASAVLGEHEQMRFLAECQDDEAEACRDCLRPLAPDARLKGVPFSRECEMNGFNDCRFGFD